MTRPGNLVVSWVPGGRDDFFEVNLSEVIQQTDRITLERRRGYRIWTPPIEIQDTLLIPNHRYVLTVSTIIGFPDAATGDYATHQYPITTATGPFIAR